MKVGGAGPQKCRRPSLEFPRAWDPWRWRKSLLTSQKDPGYTAWWCPRAPKPLSPAGAGLDRLSWLHGRWPHGCSNHCPAEDGGVDKPAKIQQMPEAAGRGSLRIHPRLRSRSPTPRGCSPRARGRGDHPDPAHSPGHGAHGAPGHRRLFCCVPGSTLGAEAVAHAGIYGSRPLEVAEPLCLPDAQPAHRCRVAAGVRSSRVAEARA